MSVQYVIDGYNLIWSADHFGGGRLQDQRDRLLRFLESSRPAGSHRNSITVVFDGQEDVDSPPWRGSVHVIFSRGEDADAVIKRKIDSMENARNAIVVTDDRDIQRWVRASKAKVLSCREFLENVARPKSKGPEKSSSKSLDVYEASAITEEFKRIFLQQ